MAQSTQYQSEGNKVGSDTKERVNDQFERIAGAATDQLNKAADSVENAAGRVAEQGRAAGQQVQEVAGNIKGAVDKSIKEQPMATLALVAALGFVLGALWKS
jgi:ElaB/YqjD/DUF883 family membrane-anchored ribosome-binding protein